MAFHLVTKRIPADTQRARRLGLVAVGPLQSFSDQPLFVIVESGIVNRRWRGTARRRLPGGSLSREAKVLRQILNIDGFRHRHHASVADYVLQFSDVAG